MFTTTFVSSLFLPKDGTYRSIERYKECFAALAATGVPILLYLDPTLKDYGGSLERKWPNVRIADYIGYDRQIIQEGSYVLPANRNYVKDTADYMCIQLMKLRLVARATAITDTPYMAWIDFGIFHMFNDWDQASTLLQAVAKAQWPTREILSPGCWDDRAWNIWDAICWRHCGSFFLGARGRFESAVQEQDALVREGLPRLTWEVNYWSRMKCFQVYKADHNISLLLHLLPLQLTAGIAESVDQDRVHTNPQNE
jgi:hypothetical protein